MRVAAIQMTSGHDIEANLEAATRYLEEAARLNAVLAALPENFAFMGQNSGDKRVIAEPDGAGRIQNFLADTARRLKLWIVGGTVPLRQGADGRVAVATAHLPVPRHRCGRPWHQLDGPALLRRVVAGDLFVRNCQRRSRLR